MWNNLKYNTKPMSKKDFEEFKKLVAKWMKWSLEKQDKVFQSSRKNRKLFEKAKALATF